MPRLRGFLWLLSGLAVALVAAYVGFVTCLAPLRRQHRGRQQPQDRRRGSGTSDSGRTLIQPDDVELKQLPVGSVPPDQ